jgi:ABC-2 type transport system permease protein
LGAAFPDFKSENPAKIVSGFGGTLTLIASIGFILIAVAVTIFPFQLFLKGHISTYVDLKKAAMISMGIVSLIGIGLCLFPLLYGEKKLAAMEF